MKKKYTYIWVSLIVLVFGIIFIPRIVERIKSGSIVENTRMNVAEGVERPLEYITLNDKKRRVPPFSFLNQDSLLITNEDYKGKVYVVEFFFTTCPT
ncbi:MAG: SCO family protein, partial [Flavobacteriaceae bacterium]|nr:SCO family protein [Muriicola sp.]NNL38447.1 SCO family protein [Flavobacteriaceae bacterium]